MTKIVKDIVEVCLKEDLQKVLHKATDLKEMSAFGREFAYHLKHDPYGSTYRSKVTGKMIPVLRKDQPQRNIELAQTKELKAAPTFPEATRKELERMTSGSKPAQPVQQPAPRTRGLGSPSASEPTSSTQSDTSAFRGRMIPSREAGIDKIPEPMMTMPQEPGGSFSPISKGPFQFNRVAPVTSGSKPSEPVATQSQPAPASTSVSNASSQAAKDAGDANQKRNDFANYTKRNPNYQQFSVQEEDDPRVTTPSQGAGEGLRIKQGATPGDGSGTSGSTGPDNATVLSKTTPKASAKGLRESVQIGNNKYRII